MEGNGEIMFMMLEQKALLMTQNAKHKCDSLKKNLDNKSQYKQY